MIESKWLAYGWFCVTIKTESFVAPSRPSQGCYTLLIRASWRPAPDYLAKGASLHVHMRTDVHIYKLNLCRMQASLFNQAVVKLDLQLLP